MPGDNPQAAEHTLDPERTAPAAVIERMRAIQKAVDSLTGHDPTPVAADAVNAGDRVRITIEAVITNVQHGDEHTGYLYAPTDQWPNGAYTLELPSRPTDDTTITVEVI